MSAILFEIPGSELDSETLTPFNISGEGEEFDDIELIYSNQVHLTRMLSDEELKGLMKIESGFNLDGNLPDELKDWDEAEHNAWINFDFFSNAARAYLESLPE